MTTSADKYLCYIHEDETSRYYKNENLHREAGPAIVFSKDKEKYTNLGDEGLYKKTYEPVVSEREEKTLISIVVYLMSQAYNDSEFYLQGKKYSKEEFNIIMFKEKMDKELAQLGKSNNKKPKL